MKELFENIGIFLLVCVCAVIWIVLSAFGTVVAVALSIAFFIAAVIVAVFCVVCALIAVLFSQEEEDEGKDNAG